MMTTEERVLQRESALQKANRIRSERKLLKAQLAAGELDLTDLILDPPEVIHTAAVGEVLEWMPGIGPTRARKILNGGAGGPVCGRAVKLGYLGAKTRKRICERIELTTPVRLGA